MIKTSKIPFGKYHIYSTSTAGSDKAIIFVHGNSQTAESWDQQVSDTELKNKYQLISFDLPGHGQSDWFKKDDTSLYDLKEMRKAVEAVINFYQPQQYILVGLSYGTNLIAEIINPLTRCKGIVLAGAHILATGTDISSVLKTLDAPPVTAMPQVTDDDLEKFCQYLSQYPEKRQIYINSYKKADPEFRSAVAKNIVGQEWSDEPSNLSRHSIPTMVLFGQLETLIYTQHLENYKSVWVPKVVIVENSGHLVNQENPREFNKLLLEFADNVFK